MKGQGKDFRKHYYSFLTLKGVSGANFAQIDNIIGPSNVAVEQQQKNFIVELKQLKDVCQRSNFKFATKHRTQIWKLFLGIYSPNRDNWQFTDAQCNETYKMLVENAPYLLTPQHIQTQQIHVTASLKNRKSSTEDELLASEMALALQLQQQLETRIEINNNITNIAPSSGNVTSSSNASSIKPITFNQNYFAAENDAQASKPNSSSGAHPTTPRGGRIVSPQQEQQPAMPASYFQNQDADFISTFVFAPGKHQQIGEQSNIEARKVSLTPRLIEISEEVLIQSRLSMAKTFLHAIHSSRLAATPQSEDSAGGNISITSISNVNAINNSSVLEQQQTSGMPLLQHATVDAYFCMAHALKRLCKYASSGKLQESILQLVRECAKICQTQDQELFTHLYGLGPNVKLVNAEKIQARVDQCIAMWMNSLFASQLHPTTVHRLWDCIFAYSFDMLACVAFVLLKTMRSELLSTSDPDALSRILCNVRVILSLFGCVIYFLIIIILFHCSKGTLMSKQLLYKRAKFTNLPPNSAK